MPPLTELALIQKIARAAAARSNGKLKLGIGDDCAILRPPAGHEILVTTDFSLEARHFRRDWHTPESAGHRTLARGLSDLAAMGAKPLAAFLSLALPAAFNPRWVERFFAGLLALAKAYGVPLAGGDTAQAPGAQVLADIVLVGSAPAGRALRRSGARAGDRIFVTGALGGAAAELEALAKGRKVGGDGPQSFPQPRLAVGQALLRQHLATACIDLSDGLSTDLTHLCEASSVSAILDAPAIPIHPLARGRMELALHGGEDYELLFTAPVAAKLPTSLRGVALTEIGRVARRRAGRPAVLLDGRPLAPGGWEHFKP
jgi:thiamine-monophosphate kinase